MMKKTCLIFLLFVSVGLFGQDLQKNGAIKLYTSFDYSPRYIYHESDTADGSTLREYGKEINGFNFSPALVFYNTKGNSSEIEIARFGYSNNYNKEYAVIDSTGAVVNTVSGFYEKQFELFIRYEYKLHLFKKKNWKTIKPVIGFSATPFFQWSRSEPMVSNEFASSEASVGLYLSVIPRIEYVINERWYLDLNIPVAVVTSHYNRTRYDSPLLPENERVEGTLDFYSGPISFAVRFGAGFKIW